MYMDQCRLLGSVVPAHRLTHARVSSAGYLGLSELKSTLFISCCRTSIRIRSKFTLTVRNHFDDVSPVSNNGSMFILGMGFVGQFLAQELKDLGWSVTGTCRRQTKKEKLNELGFDVHTFDAYNPEMNVLDILNRHTHLVVSIPPAVGLGDPMLRHEELLRSLLRYGNLKLLCYLSSTSVYGDCRGKLVDENYPTLPTSESARLRLAAEEGWSLLGQELGLSSVVLRLGGVYGPGRSAINTIIKQKPLSELQTRRALRKYTSRVHVKDICQALKASIVTPYCSNESVVPVLRFPVLLYQLILGLERRQTFNVVDDDPAPREEVFAYAKKLVEQKWPHLIKQYADVTEFRNWECTNEQGEKRVSNAKMKEELGIRLQYPNYRLGLRSIIDQMDCSF